MEDDKRHQDTSRAVPRSGDATSRDMQASGSAGRGPETPRPEGEGFLHALVGSTSDIVVVLDAGGVVRYENPAVERVLGYRPEESIGNSAFDRVHPDDADRVREDFGKALAKPGAHPPVRFRVRHADGSWRHVETVRNNLLDDPAVRGMVNISRDVTEREEVLETLRRSRAEFRAVFDRSAVGMALVDAEGRLKKSNLALRDMLDYDAGELKEMHFRDVTHPDDVAADTEMFEKMMAGELDHFRLEKRYVRKDGSQIWGHLTSSVIHGDDGKPRLMVGMVEDVTERRRAEEKLQASEAELKALFAAMYDIVLVLDRDGRCLRVASANPSLLYRPAQEQVGKTLHEILPSDKADLLLDRVRRALDTGRPLSVEYSLTIEGSERWFSANVSPMSDGRVVWVAHDTTGWKEMETALRESEERYRALMEQSVEAIYLYDADTKQVLESNAAFQEMVAYTGEELRGMRIYDFIAHEPEDIDRNVERSLKEKRRYVGERTYRRKDGADIIVDTSATVISYGGRTALCAISRDVTERRRLEEALREREEHFRALIRNAPDTITILDAHGIISYDSPSVERVLGYRPDERIGSNGFDYVHPEDLERALRTFGEALSSPGVGRPVEYRLRHKNGSWRHFEAVRTNLLDDPAIGGIVLNYRDATERLRAEADLRDSEERHRRLVENSPETIAILSEGKIAFINAAGAELAGADGPEQMIGKPFLDFVHPDSREAVRRRVAQALEGKTTELMHQKLLRADGSVIEAEAVTIPTTYAGKPAVHSIIRDITERLRAERQLRASEEQFRGAFEDASTGMALVGLDRRFMQVNRALCEMLGRSEEELLSTRTPEITHFDDLQPSEERTERLISGLGDQSLEKRYVHADGHTVWVVSDVSLVRDSEGNPSHFVSLFQDITERKRAEKALKASEERFRSVVQNSSEVIKIVDIDGTLKYASPAFERVFGYDPDESLGMNVLDHVHPDDLPLVVKATQKTMGDPASGNNVARYRFRHADGSWRHVESAGTYLLDEPTVEGVVVNVRDVTERHRAEKKLRASEERFRRLVQQTPEMIAVHSEGKLVFINAAGTELLGAASPEELIGKDVMDHVHPDYREIVRSRMHRMESEGQDTDLIREKFLRTDGSAMDVEVTTTFTTYQGKPATQVVARDITERLRAETELRESEERYRAVVEQSVESIYLFDPHDKRILESNAALEQLLGYTSEELSRLTIYDIVAHSAEDIDMTTERHLLEERRFVGERRYRHKDGALIDVEVSATVIPYRDREAVCAVARNVTEQKALEEQLTHQAFHDSLTDLPNRALFLDRLDHALARVRRERGSVAVLFVDLDDFKSVNDTLGHEAGDRLLGEVARRLQSCVRPGDTVGRLFGDEYGVLLDMPAEVDEARRVTERIMERLQAPFELDGREVFVTSSIGIASGPSTYEPEDPEQEQSKDILRRADLAMYAAKSGGKGHYEIFNPSMNTRAVERMELKNEIRRAVEHGEFEVYYQPIIWSRTGEVSGLEALVRWKHPEKGLVAAEEFIEMAEESGLIHPIGGWVFEQVCEQAGRWIEDGSTSPLLMSVNFSASQFANQADTISRVLGNTRIAPENLIIEITERAVMDNAEFALGKLNRLKGLGVQFAIDDYGTGYSCLRYLKLMPVDYLKIDRMFIAGLGKDSGDTAIVRGTINLAHALGLKVIAEGVETAEQHERLKELDCDMVQGFHFSHPLSASEASALLNQSPPRRPE